MKFSSYTMIVDQLKAHAGFACSLIRSLVYMQDECNREIRSQRKSMTTYKVSKTEFLTEQIATSRRTLSLLTDAAFNLEEPVLNAIIVRYDMGLSWHEAAKSLNISIDLLKERIHSGLKELKTLLDESHNGDSSKWRKILMPLIGQNRK